MGGFRRKSRPAPPPPPPPPPPKPATPSSSTGAAKGGQVGDDMTLETGTTGSQQLRRRRKGKRSLVAGQTVAAQVGGEGSSGLNIPKG